MKKMGKKISLGLALMLAAGSISACGKKAEDKTTEAQTEQETTQASVQEETTEAATADEPDTATADAKGDTDYEAVYAPILKEIYDTIQSGYDYDHEDDYKYITIGIRDDIDFEDKSDLMKMIGYKIEDISGDGVPELLIGKDATYKVDGEPQDSYVMAGYTCKDSEPVQFLEGWSRNSFVWLGDGKFSYFGSGGATNSAFGKCHVTQDGTDLEWDDFYFTREKTETELSYYHNKTGEWDEASSEELQVTDEEFWEMDKYEAATIDWTPIGEFKGEAGDSENSEGVTSGDITVEYMDERPSTFIEFEEGEETEYTVHVLFSAKKDVNNFRLVGVTLENVDDDGNAKYSYQVKYELDTLSSKTPLYTGLTFPGDLPSNGFIYTDDNGNDRFFVISQSGEDGSLVVTEEAL